MLLASSKIAKRAQCPNIAFLGLVQFCPMRKRMLGTWDSIPDNCVWKGSQQMMVRQLQHLRWCSVGCSHWSLGSLKGSAERRRKMKEMKRDPGVERRQWRSGMRGEQREETRQKGGCLLPPTSDIIIYAGFHLCIYNIWLNTAKNAEISLILLPCWLPNHYCNPKGGTVRIPLPLTEARPAEIQPIKYFLTEIKATPFEFPPVMQQLQEKEAWLSHKVPGSNLLSSRPGFLHITPPRSTPIKLTWTAIGREQTCHPTLTEELQVADFFPHL